MLERYGEVEVDHAVVLPVRVAHTEALRERRRLAVEAERFVVVLQAGEQVAEASEHLQLERAVFGVARHLHRLAQVLQRLHEVAEAEVGVRLADVHVAVEAAVSRLVAQAVAGVGHRLVVLGEAFVAAREVPVGLGSHLRVLRLVRHVDLHDGVGEHVAVLAAVAVRRRQVPERQELVLAVVQAVQGVFPLAHGRLVLLVVVQLQAVLDLLLRHALPHRGRSPAAARCVPAGCACMRPVRERATGY